MARSIINPKRQAKKQAMAAAGIKSGKTYRRMMIASKPVRPNYYKDKTLVPTKRIRMAAWADGVIAKMIGEINGKWTRKKPALSAIRPAGQATQAMHAGGLSRNQPDNSLAVGTIGSAGAVA
jgi:hypothetical protein